MVGWKTNYTVLPVFPADFSSSWIENWDKKGHQFDLVEGIQEKIMKQLIISEMLREMATW